jgi:protein-tyrosine-phosphatase
VLAAAVAGEGPPQVVFVCAHGNVKSLIASVWFDRLAAERGIAARSTARGLTPENPVPALVAERLRSEGSDVAGYEARGLAAADVEGAAHLVLIGVEAPSWARRDGLTVHTWDGIPPASERYEASRDAMRARIEEMLAGLKARQAP